MAGPRPSFSEAHVVRVLLSLLEGRSSRRLLMRESGLGEGSIKTILKRLRLSGLAASSKLGHELTEKGREKTGEILDWFSNPIIFQETDIFPGLITSCILVKGAAGRLSHLGTLESVSCMNAGADGCAILVARGGELVFPGGIMDLNDYKVAGKLLENIGYSEGDAVVLAASEDETVAVISVLSVAVDLSEKVKI